MPSKPKSNSTMSDPRHLLRYLKSQAGATPAEIAKQEGVSQATVRQSILQVEAYRKRSTPEELNFAMRDFVISSIPVARDTFQGLLRATELVEVNDHKTGKKKVVEMEDKVTRMEAMKIMSTLISNFQPKESPVQVNVTQTNQNAAIVNAAETTEERFRRLRKKQQEFNLLPPEVAAVPDHIDAGDDNPDILDGDEEDDEDGDEDDE